MKPSITLFACILLALPLAAQTQPATGPKDPVPVPAPAEPPALLFHKAPPASPPSEEIRLVLQWQGTWKGSKVVALFRRLGGGPYREVPGLRDAQGRYVAVIPAADAMAPGIEYYVESVEEGGARRARFGTAAQPHPVIIDPAPADAHLQARLDRHDGRRSQISTTFAFQSFGSRVFEETGGRYGDYFNLAEIEYTYRFLLDELYQLSFGYGMLGGKIGAMDPGRQLELDLHPNQDPPLKPGVYYGYAKAYWEFADLVGIEPRLILGASYRGFEGGGGLVLRIGRIGGTCFDAGVEGISHVGWRFITQFQWDTVPHVLMSLRTETTTFPKNGTRGSIPSFNVTGLLGKGMELTASIGYGSRKGYDKGGISTSGSFRFSF